MKSKLLGLLLRVVWAAVAGCSVGALSGWGTAQFLRIPQADRLASFRPHSTTHVYAANGEPVASYALERRVELKPEQIPDHLKLAIVAIEDAEFYEHGGVDPKAVTRALVDSLRTGRFGGGGGASTLTQQLARNLFLTPERTISRKVREMLLAIDIEKRLSKDQILAMYANQVFLGHGAYGVEAASQLYFACPAIELSLSQAALLAGMIQNPNRLNNPFRNPEGALARRNKVLRSMLQLGFVDEERYLDAVEEPLGAALHRERVSTGSYYLEMVRQEIEQQFGTDALYTNGLEVHTTLDVDLQRAAETAVREGLVSLDMALGYRRPPNVLEHPQVESVEGYEDPSWSQLTLAPAAMVRAVVAEVERRSARLTIAGQEARLELAGADWTGTSSLARILKPGDLVLVRLPEELPEDQAQVLAVELLQEPSVEGALVALDSRSGAILALVGGFDFERSEFNRATQALRQCGSAFKPFVYLTAFQQGYTPADRVFDAPFLLPDATGELTYCPKNYYLKYYGMTTLRRALELSFNASAVKLQQLVGSEAVVETARRLGITSTLHPYPSLALGSLEVRLLDLTRAYAGIANLGEVPEPYFITEVHDRDGRLVQRAFPVAEQVIAPAAAYLMVHVLRGVVERGTGQGARSLDAHLAGKTGTTDDYTDAWFLGFSPRITVGVWVGRDLKETIGRRMTGAVAALPIWTRFMKAQLATLDEAERSEDFPVPAGVVFTPVDWYSGRRVVPGCKRVILEAFLDGTEPSEPCSEELHGLAELPWPFQQPSYTPRPGEPMPSVDAIAAADQRLRPDGEDEG